MIARSQIVTKKVEFDCQSAFLTIVTFLKYKSETTLPNTQRVPALFNTVQYQEKGLGKILIKRININKMGDKQSMEWRKALQVKERSE